MSSNNSTAPFSPTKLVDFPPGNGTDAPIANKNYIISILGTNDVLEASDRSAIFRRYEANRPAQLWIRSPDVNKNLTQLHNPHEKVYLTRARDGDNITVSQEADTNFFISRLVDGGFNILHLSGKTLYYCNVNKTSENRDAQLITSLDPETRLGFHLAPDDPAPFPRFEWIIPGKLARAAPPHFKGGKDVAEEMNSSAINYLKEVKVAGVISLNAAGGQPGTVLEANQIGYHHAPIKKDSLVPTLEQLHGICSFFDGVTKNGAVVVYCGNGQSRTGTVVSALQIHLGRDMNSLDFFANGIEMDGQETRLEDFRARGTTNPTNTSEA